jgi:hypothetical protein
VNTYQGRADGAAKKDIEYDLRYSSLTRFVMFACRVFCALAAEIAAPKAMHRDRL